MKLIRSKNDDFKKVSYSQTGEDLIIRFIFDILGVPHPSFLDIGAHHPRYLNNTAVFYDAGSRGVNVEPDPELFKQFPRERPKDNNLNIGISDKEGVADFYIMSEPTLNTFSKNEAEKYQKDGYAIDRVIKVNTKSINTVLHNTLRLAPDFMNLDAEGINLDILKTMDFKKFEPKVICVETISFSRTGRGVKDQELINYIIDKGYMIYADTYINSIFIKERLWRK